MFPHTNRVLSLTVLCVAALAGVLADTGSASAAKKYRYCSQDLPQAFVGACEAACYKQRWENLQDRDKCVDEWAKTQLPAHPCRSDDFIATCEAFTKSSCRVSDKPDVTSHYKLSALGRFAQGVERIAETLAAAQKLEGSYSQCLGPAAYTEHKVKCIRELKAPAVQSCVSLGGSLKETWAAALKTTEAKFIQPGIEAAAAGPDRYGKLPKAVGLAEKALLAIDKYNENALIKAAFDTSPFKTQLADARKKGEDAAGAKKEANAKDRDAKDEAEANETAENLPNAKMKNAKLAKQVKAIIEQQWPKDELKKVILSTKKWTTNYVYIGNYRTDRIANKAIDVHVITRPENGKRCRLYEVSVVQRRHNKEWGEVSWGGVGNSKATLCPGE